MHESSCEVAVLGLHHMRQKNQLHFKECMIQGFCENSMVRFYARNDQPGRMKCSNILKLHKPITLQDALPRSDSNRDNLPRSDPLSLAETSPLSSSQSKYRSPYIEEVEALTINPEATID
ncbi:hypothetical protein GQ457_13G016500 [Hibiscus cannabinus]